MTNPNHEKQEVIRAEVLGAGFYNQDIKDLARADPLDLEELVQCASGLNQTNEPATTSFGTIQSDAQRAAVVLFKIQSHWPDGLPARLG